jgi:hypothetical protein
MKSLIVECEIGEATSLPSLSLLLLLLLLILVYKLLIVQSDYDLKGADLSRHS